MRKLFICLFLVSVWMTELSAQRVVNNPAYEFRSTGRYRIGQFVLSDTATKMQLINEYIPGWYIAFNQKCIHLENPETGEKYYALRADNFEWDKHLTTPDCGRDTFYFTFPPLPKDLKTVNCIDDIRGIYGISLFSPTAKKKKDIQEIMDGNWLTTDGTNRWKYGFYPKFALAGNRFWNYESWEKKGNAWLVSLVSEGQHCRLWVKPEGDGSCRIGTDRKNLTLFRPDRGEVETGGSPAEARCASGGRAHIQGYFRGFDPRATILKTGTIYTSNIVSDEDYPMAIDIQPDGRFAFDLEMEHPGVNMMTITRSGSGLRFYAEPGDTLTICIDWEDWLLTDRYRNRVFKEFNTLRYMGPHSKVNTDLTKAWPYFANLSFSCGSEKQKYMQFTPAAYKQYVQAYTKTQLTLLDSLAGRFCFSPKSLRVMKAQLLGRQATELIDFVNNRKLDYFRAEMPELIRNAPEPADYYDFLQQMPLNDPCMLSPMGGWAFINRFEFAEPFRIYIQSGVSSQVGYATQLWTRRDSVCQYRLKLVPSFCYEVTKVRFLANELQTLPSQQVDGMVWAILPGISTPYLRGKVMELRDKYASDKLAPASAIPERRGAEIFRKLIAPYAGKVVFVDFWATFCGPCLAGIKSMAPMREKYEGKEVVFLFITSEEQSPQKDYNRVMADVKGEKLRISQSEFTDLQELFRFSAIPFYVLLNRKGEWVNARYYGAVDREKLIDKVLEEEYR